MLTSKELSEEKLRCIENLTSLRRSKLAFQLRRADLESAIVVLNHHISTQDTMIHEEECRLEKLKEVPTNE